MQFLLPDGLIFKMQSLLWSKNMGSAHSWSLFVPAVQSPPHSDHTLNYNVSGITMPASKLFQDLENWKRTSFKSHSQNTEIIQQQTKKKCVSRSLKIKCSVIICLGKNKVRCLLQQMHHASSLHHLKQRAHSSPSDLTKCETDLCSNNTAWLLQTRRCCTHSMPTWQQLVQWVSSN